MCWWTSALFDAGDDCVAIKAGKNRDTQYGPAQHIVIQDCTMLGGHGGIAFGSETAGGIERVYAQNLVFENLDIAIRVKTNMNRGGFVRHCHVRNVQIPNGLRTTSGLAVARAGGGIVTFDCDYAPGVDVVRGRPPEVRDIHVSNVAVGNGDGFSCYQAIVALGPMAEVGISDCDFGTPANQAAPWYLANVNDLRLKNVRIAGKTFDMTLSV